jgi:hypothetical protein
MLFAAVRESVVAPSRQFGLMPFMVANECIADIGRNWPRNASVVMTHLRHCEARGRRIAHRKLMQQFKAVRSWEFQIKPNEVDLDVRLDNSGCLAAVGCFENNCPAL